MLSHEQMQQAAQGGRTQHAVYVYEAPVRLWHWITVLAMTVLMATGYFIGTPFLMLPGDDAGMYRMDCFNVALCGICELTIIAIVM